MAGKVLGEVQDAAPDEVQDVALDEALDEVQDVALDEDLDEVQDVAPDEDQVQVAQEIYRTEGQQACVRDSDEFRKHPRNRFELWLESQSRPRLEIN
jgi:hypothetical protein